MNLSRVEMEHIGEVVNKPASTIYRWRSANPPLFEAVYEYALKNGLTPEVSDKPKATHPAIPIAIRNIARHYRWANPGHKGGVVLIYLGTAYGWKDKLRDPQSECPGAYAVDADDCVFVAMGGNNHDGAERWEAMQ